MFHRATVFLVLVIVLAVASLPCCHAGRDRKRSTLARQITRQHSLGSLGYRDHEKAADSLSTRR